MKVSIFDIDNWREIGATLSRNKARTFLTAFGIFWGTAMLAILWGGASGLKGLLMRNFDGFATNMAVVAPGRTSKPYKGYNKGRQINLNQQDLENIKKNVAHIDASSGIIMQAWNVGYNSTSKSQVFCEGVQPDYFKIQTPIIYKGRIFNDKDSHDRKKVVLIGKNLASEFFKEEEPLGKYLNINGIYFQIIGVVGQRGEFSIGNKIDDSVLMPENVMRNTYALGNNIDFMMFTVDPGYDPEDVHPLLMRVIRSNHPIDPEDETAVHFMNVAHEFKMVDNIFLGVSILALFVGAGTLMAGIIGVGNIMWIIVKERTQEIGIRRAIGATPRDIIIQILSEGIALTAIAGFLGIVFATLVLFIIDKITTDPMTGSAHFLLRFNQAVGIMCIFLVLGSCAGMIPSLKAMKIKPVEAMRNK